MRPPSALSNSHHAKRHSASAVLDGSLEKLEGGEEPRLEEYHPFGWPCGQRFPAEEAVIRRLACSSVPRQPTIEANGIVDQLQGQFTFIGD
jgi:hypothetical protein